jgi:hypothetical protein
LILKIQNFRLVALKLDSIEILTFSVKILTFQPSLVDNKLLENVGKILTFYLKISKISFTEINFFFNLRVSSTHLKYLTPIRLALVVHAGLIHPQRDAVEQYNQHGDPLEPCVLELRKTPPIWSTLRPPTN